MDLFSPEARRNPYPVYEQLRQRAPVFEDPRTGLWTVFGYEDVKRVLQDHETFSSRLGPVDWLIFLDGARHAKLRALIAQAFTARSVANLEPRIRALVLGLLEPALERGEMDVAVDFAVPLPLMVIAEMLGVPPEDRAQFVQWNDAILNMSYTVARTDPDAARAAAAEFEVATGEMNAYLGAQLARRRAEPRDDLLTRLLQVEVEGERLDEREILGFFQLLMAAGSETTTLLIANAMLCFLEHPDQRARVAADPGLLPSAIEEVLRYRSPFQWMFRLVKHDVAIRDTVIPAGKVVLAMMGAANRDPAVFPDPHWFDVARDPNPHLAFGQGVHFCLGAPLARLESRVALTELLGRLKRLEPASDEPWEPRPGLHVMGPARLPIRFEPAPLAAAP
jgi:cytochrome P450